MRNERWRAQAGAVWFWAWRTFCRATTVGKRLKDDIHFIATGCWEGVFSRRAQGGLFSFALALAHSMRMMIDISKKCVCCIQRAL